MNKAREYDWILGLIQELGLGSKPFIRNELFQYIMFQAEKNVALKIFKILLKINLGKSVAFDFLWHQVTQNAFENYQRSYFYFATSTTH